MTDLEELHSWCALWRTPTVGAKRFLAILKAFDSPKAFLLSSDTQRQSLGVRADADAISKAQIDAEKDIRWLQDTADAHICLYTHVDYPNQLKRIADAPPILFIRGDVTLLSAPQLAVVGSRTPSHEGVENARNFAQFMTQNGVVITSGLALGVDGAAHEGALSAKARELSGETVAVMGTGADRIYPAKHRDLAYRIVERGCIVTELPIGTPVVSHAFPRRNRIISGLSLGTLVVEAGLKSGSLITARTALEQNREVFAIPGSIHNPLARGCNHLIRNGAKLVETAKDIFEELQSPLLAFVENEKSDTLNNKVSSPQPITEHSTPMTEVTLDAEQQLLWNALSHDPQPVDVLVQRSGLAANQVSSMLLILELSGRVIKQPGGRYQKSIK